MLVSLRRFPVFTLAALTALALAGLNAVMIALMQLQPGFMGMAHFTDPRHRVHDLTFGFLFLPAVIGMLGQLRQPSRNVAGQLMALIPWLALVKILVLTGGAPTTGLLNGAWIGVAAATLLAALLHPTGRDLFRSFRVSRINPVMLGLIIVATVPLIAFAATNLGLQTGPVSDHAVHGHYGFMAAFSFTVIGIGLLASLRPAGWRLAAWVAGFLPLLLGLTSILIPDVDSSLSSAWALAAIAWAAGFVAAAEFTCGGRRLADPPTQAGSEPSEPTPASLPRWIYALGAVALALVLLFLGMHLVGGGPVLHAPPPSAHGAH